MNSKPTYEELLQQIVELEQSESRRETVEIALRENQRKLATLMGNLPGMVFRCLSDAEWTMEFVSEGCSALIGCMPEDLLGNANFSYGDLIHKDDRQMVQDIVQKALRDRQKYQLTYRIITPDGTQKCVWEQGQEVEDPAGGPSVIEGFITDITDRKQADEKLARSEMFLHEVINGIGDPLFVKDEDHRVLAVNDAYCEYFRCSRDDVIGKDDYDLFPPDEAEVFWARDDIVMSGNQVDINEEEITIDNETRILSTVKSPLPNLPTGRGGLVGTIRDITQQKEDMEELQMMRNLQSVGLLAGGIAHDFNNILTSLFGNIALAVEELPSNHPAYKALVDAQMSMGRATGLTRQLLTFAKGGMPVKEVVDLGRMIEEVTCLDLSGCGVKYELEQAPDLWAVEVDGGQMQQVFSNLATNAKQAMPDGGNLHITLENSPLDDQEVMNLPAGDYLKITVVDDGPGIDSEHRARIFDPYFSTKQKGSGLGLATSYSIISKHDGRIDVDTGPDRGTTFTIYLPASPEIPADHTISPESSSDKTALAPRILLMDDDLSILKLVTRMLGKHGMTVETAVHGKAAIDMYGESLAAGEPYDVVIMDLTIPGGTGGKDAVRELLALDPTARVIVSSGYSEDPVMTDPAAYGFKGIAVKPYTTDMLLGVLGKVMAVEKPGC